MIITSAALSSFKKNAWPLPECRLIEWCAIIDSIQQKQYGWDKTESKYLLTIHNDIDVRADVVGNLLKAMDNHTGVGEIGQCWWCPAFQNGLCDSERYIEFKPSYQ